jgi:GTP-binding protein HflX
MLDWIERAPGVRVPRVWVSAIEGDGLDLLREQIARMASGQAPEPGEHEPLPEADAGAESPEQHAPTHRTMQA